MMERPIDVRSIVEDRADELQITIPAKKDWFTIIFIGVWLCFWIPTTLLFLFSIIKVSVREPVNWEYIPITLFLTIWILGGVYAFKQLWWVLKGKEIITVNPKQIIIERKNALFEKPKIFWFDQIKDLSVYDEDKDPKIWRKRGDNSLPRRRIRFYYYDRSIKFMDHVSDGEATYLLALIKRRLLIGDR